MRRRPDPAGILPPMYFIFRTSSRAEGCSNAAMKPSLLRIFAISTLVRDVGIVTLSWRPPAALRTRVSMSPTGSFGTPTTFGRGLRVEGTRLTGGATRSARSPPSGVTLVVVVSSVIFSPARLRHAGQLAHERALAEADPAQAELAHVPTWAAAHLAAVVALHLELRRALRLEDQALLRHLAFLRLLLERHAEALQQSARLFIRLRGRDDRDLHATQSIDLVVLDLREHQLLLEAEREVAAPVEAALRDPLEVADPRERDGDELLVEVPHALAAERDLDADGHPDAQLEVRDGLARLRDHRALAGDDREVVRGGVHGLAVADGLAHADVHDDLLHARY